MTSAELKEKLHTRCEEVEALQELWATLMPDVLPDAPQYNVWLELHPLERMVYAINATGAKHLRLEGKMSLEHAVRFCSKVANVRRTWEEGPAGQAA